MNRRLLLCLALGTSMTAFAEQGDQWVVAKGAYTQFDSHTAPQDTYGYGVGYGVWCTTHFGVDLSLLRTQLKSRLATATGTSQQHQLLGSLLFSFHPDASRFFPYLAVGVGATQVGAAFSDNHHQTTRAAYHAGLGAKIRFADRGLITLDSKYVRTQANTVRNDWLNTVGVGVVWGAGTHY